MTTRGKRRTISGVKKELESFLKQNSYSQVEKQKGHYFVINPWNDESIQLYIPDSPQKIRKPLIDALNNLILPPRFTALYHVDLKLMEFIYTVVAEDDPTISREFEFTLDGESYTCSFGNASGRLILLSSCFLRTDKITRTEYRNLLEFRGYLQQKSEPYSKADIYEGLKPTSFYIKGFDEYKEDSIIEISKHINFFMHYYNRDTPHIVIHAPETATELVEKPVGLIEGTFPPNISARRQDPFLLDLVLAAVRVETRLQFIYYYQILEYAAFYYIPSEVKRNLMKILATPDILSNPDKYISRILETTESTRQDDESKINKTIRDACCLDIIWKELQQNKSYFSEEQSFDGGFTQGPLISENTTFEEFCGTCYPKIPDSLRHIRNALVHGREKRAGYVISPTERNNLLLKPWRDIVRRMTEQVIIFSTEKL